MPKQIKALSFDERQGLIRDAIRELTEPSMDYSGYIDVCDVYDDYAIVRDWREMAYWRVDYTIDEATQAVTVKPQAEWQHVEKEWVDLADSANAAAVAIDDVGMATMSVRSPLKALGDGKVGGYLVLFGDETKTDLTNDFFTKSTDFDIEDGDKVSVYYNHGYDPVLKTRKIGAGTVEKQDVGLWVQAQLDLRDEYERAIYGMVEAGKMGWSSGTLPNLVEREAVGKAWHIKKWPIGKDASITPTPAESRIVATTLKSLLDGTTPDAPEATPEVPAGTANAANASQSTDIQILTGEEAMANEAVSEDIKAVNGKVDSLTERMDTFMKAMENSPALKSAGYFTQDGGKADKHVKSLGDFFLAVSRHDVKRLEEVYGSHEGDASDAVKDLSSQAGQTGGFLVPTEYRADLLKIAYAQSPIVSRVTKIPVTAQAGKYPVLDVFTAPTAGTGGTAAAGKMTAAARAEGGAYTATQPQFQELEWRVTDAASGYTAVNKELQADSPIMIETLLRTLIGIDVAAKIEYFILQGTGVGQPLGILNSAAKIAYSAAASGTLAYTDGLGMLSRMKQIAGQPAWVHHPSVIPDFGNWSASSGGGAAIIVNANEAPVMQALGYPRFMSEHLAQKGAANNTLLCDFSAYLLFVRDELYVDFSEHVNFLTGKNTWRFGSRLDGMPWLKNVITLGGPGSAFTQSPFVAFNN